MKDTNRIGQFKVTYALLRQDWRVLLPVMARVVVVRADNDLVSDTITYSAFSSDFDPVDEGAEAPMYAVELEKVGGKTVFKRFVKV